jgi:hypothetical protein
VDFIIKKEARKSGLGGLRNNSFRGVDEIEFPSTGQFHPLNIVVSGQVLIRRASACEVLLSKTGYFVSGGLPVFRESHL